VPASPITWSLLIVGAALAVYALFVVALLIAGRQTDARALGGFIPDCIVLMKRLLGDDRVPRRRKAVLLGLVAYLLTPIDLVPDFVPVAGQLDDAIIAAFALRYVLRSQGPGLLREHWPGPESSRDLVIRLAFGRGD
jgi:uncharacterized membrane protein YkvA (DUF1232 family)